MIKELTKEKTGLPVGWEMKKLAELGEIQTGTTPSTRNKEFYGDYIPFVKPPHFISDGTINYENEGLSEIGLNKGRLIKKNSILMVCIGATIGKTGITTIPISCNQQINAFTPQKDLEPRYFYYLLNSSIFFNEVLKLSSQATLPMINKSKWQSIKVSYPKSLTQQKQIVAILDKAFAAIDTAKANAQQNLQNSKELFESYLQNVFENKGDDWEEMALGDKNLLKIVDGDRGKNYPRKSDFQDDGYCLFMNTKNVRTEGFLFDTKMFITKEKDELMGKGKLTRNDVVMTTRGTIGNLGVYDNNVPFENIRINSGMLIFRPNQEVLSSQYLFELFRSGIMKSLIKKHVSGAAQPQLPIKTLVNFSLPIPKSLKKQGLIVQKLNALQNETKKLEVIYTQKIADLEEIKKSVLQKAFSGQLNIIN